MLLLSQIDHTKKSDRSIGVSWHHGYLVSMSLFSSVALLLLSIFVLGKASSSSASAMYCIPSSASLTATVNVKSSRHTCFNESSDVRPFLKTTPRHHFLAVIQEWAVVNRELYDQSLFLAHCEIDHPVIGKSCMKNGLKCMVVAALHFLRHCG